MGDPSSFGCKLNFSTFEGFYKVVDSDSFNFYALGLWASEFKGTP